MRNIVIDRQGNGSFSYSIDGSKTKLIQNSTNLSLSTENLSDGGLSIITDKLQLLISTQDNVTINGNLAPKTVNDLLSLLQTSVFNTANTGGGSGGGGSSDTTAANQQTAITKATELNSKIDALTDAGALKFKPVSTLPVSIAGTLPVAVQNNLTVNTISGFATSQKQDDTITKLTDLGTALSPLADIALNTTKDPDYIDPAIEKLNRLSVLLSNIYEVLDSGISVDTGATSTDPTTSAKQDTANTTLAAIANSVAGVLSVNSTINPKATNGYGSTHQAYISLDGGVGTVAITGSGDFLAGAMGKVSALIKNTGVAWNNLHIDTTEECWIFIYNVTAAPAPGLTTSIKHRHRVRVGGNSFPLKDNIFGTGLGYTLVKSGPLGSSGAIGSSGTPATIMVNLNYVA